ncbi:serine hydrolase FSH [Xylaria intraflava]|nr:serine hydrolase FSH [Xylaria intraflava]
MSQACRVFQQSTILVPTIMRFLCIHGTGSNSDIMQLQTAALRYELADDHEYDFVEGAETAPMSPDVASLASPDQSFYAFYDPNDYRGLRVAIDQLDDFVSKEGPYDAVLGFSSGAVLAALYILHKKRQGTTERNMPFKYAIFLSSARSKDAMRSLQMDPCSDIIRIPTAHIWGSGDDMEPTGGEDLCQICDPRCRAFFVHKGGHESPRDMDLIKAVHAIRRTLVAKEETSL